MAADPVRRPIGEPAAAALPAAPFAALLCLAMLCAAPAGPALAGPPPGPASGPAPLVDKPASVAKRAAPTHAWRDGAATRPLTLDPSMQADFSPKAAGAAPGAVLRPAGGALKDVPLALQSPVLRDDAGRARALPGGVMVVLAEPLDEAQARALIERHGAVPLRRIADRVWLLEAPAGLAALDQANRLAATGAFAGVQPNWWVERSLK
jgi:hypothetical protein